MAVVVGTVVVVVGSEVEVIVLDLVVATLVDVVEDVTASLVDVDSAPEPAAQAARTTVRAIRNLLLPLISSNNVTWPLHFSDQASVRELLGLLNCGPVALLRAAAK